MQSDPDFQPTALYQSFIEGPLLVGDLPEAEVFAHRDLTVPQELPRLNVGQKLGHLCEDALSVLLEASPRFDLLAQNLQIRSDDHTTVGELDFLLRDLDRDRLVHLELASKFYLAVETESGLALPGPDARDNYFKKLHRLRSHQLLLPTLHQSHLPKDYRDQSIVTQQLIYGCLFDHIHASAPAAAEYIQPNCRRGRWLSIDELPAYFPDDSVFHLIPKCLWPVPLRMLEGVALESWSPGEHHDRCVMLRVSGEALPYFVAPSGYPDACQKMPDPNM